MTNQAVLGFNAYQKYHHYNDVQVEEEESCIFQSVFLRYFYVLRKIASIID